MGAPAMTVATPTATTAAAATIAPTTAPTVAMPTPATQGIVSTPAPQSATSTPIPASVAAASTSAGSGSRHPSVLDIVRVANGAVLPLLRSGDQVIASSTRDQSGTPITFSSTRFTRAAASLENVRSGQGLVKNLSLSSIDDLNNVKASIPSDVQYVTYSMEGGMTPQAEINAAVTVVPQFASNVHSLGKKMTFIPNHRLFDNLQTNNSLETMLPSFDQVSYQAQKLLNKVSNLYSVQGIYQYLNSGNRSRGMR
jgi:hypothetical protein